MGEARNVIGAMPSEKVRGLANAETVLGFAASLQAAPLTYHRGDGDRDFVVFCFATAEAAQAFHERFGGEVLPVSPTR